jgi:hypothetical protein
MTGIDLGNGYTVDFDDADKFIKALQDQKDRLAQTLRDANRADPQPPGNDDYSGVYANDAYTMVQQHNTWNQAKQDELQGLIDKVTDAVTKYKQTEHDNTLRS